MLEKTHMLPCGEDLGVVPKCSYKVLAEFGIPGLDVQRWTRDWEGSAEFKPVEDYRVNSVAVVTTHDMSLFDAWWRDEAGTVDEALFRKNCAKHNLNSDELVSRLFDRARSRGGRLRWRSDASRDNFLWSMGRHENDVKALLGDHKTTFTEREQFWRFVGMPGHPSEDSSPELLGRALEKAAESSAVFSIQLLQDYLSLGGPLPGDPVEWRVNMPGSQGPHNWSCVLPTPLEEMASLPFNERLRDLHRRTGRDAAH
jgi:4-alpha-glucanotransferase